MALYTPEYQPTGEEIAVINTSKGPIRVQLAGNDAPIHVGNFVELAQKGFYDGLKFHRYVPGFVIQGGCPNTREATPSRWPPAALRHGPLRHRQPGYSIKEEFTTNPNNSHEDGALAMARSMDPNSAGSQFYLCLALSTTWTPAIPCSARPSRVRTSSDSCAPAMSSSPSSSRTPPSKYRPARGVAPAVRARLTPLPRRLSGAPNVE